MADDIKTDGAVETKLETGEEPDREALWAAYDQEDGVVEDASSDFEESAPAEGDEDAESADDGGEAAEAIEGGEVDTGKDVEKDKTDIWADAPEHLRSAWQKQENELRRIKHAYNSDDGRIRAYQAQVARLQEELAKRPESPAQSPAGSNQSDGHDTQKRAASKAAILKGDDWEAMREEYPDLAGVIESAFNQFGEQLEGVRGQVSTVMSDRQTAYAQQMSQELERRIPGAYDLVMGNSEQLRSWLGEQPRPIREAFQRNAQTITDVDEAAFVLSHFRDYIQSQQQTQNASASQNGSTHGSEAPASMSTRRQRQIRAAGAAGVSRGARGQQMADGVPEGREEAWSYWDKRGL